MVWSEEPDSSSAPSGDMASARTLSVWPVSLPTLRPVRGSMSRIAGSVVPIATTLAAGQVASE